MVLLTYLLVIIQNLLVGEKMSSDAQYAYNMGWTDELGGVHDFCYSMDDNYCDSNEPDYFETWQEAQEYAKKTLAQKLLVVIMVEAWR